MGIFDVSDLPSQHNSSTRIRNQHNRRRRLEGQHHKNINKRSQSVCDNDLIFNNNSTARVVGFLSTVICLFAVQMDLVLLLRGVHGLLGFLFIDIQSAGDTFALILRLLCTITGLFAVMVICL